MSPGSINIMIISVKEPQNCTCNNDPIVLHMRCLICLLGLLIVLDTTTRLPHLNLSTHHPLVKAQMPLTREKPISNIQTLNTRVLRTRPNVHFLIPTQKIRNLHGRNTRALI